MIRQPIVSILGHVDHGKTTLLDCVRGSTVAKGEAGLITQHIGASEIPIKVVKGVCRGLLEKMKIDVSIPGLLFIDTPGHAAFTTLRKRGGAIADLAVLVIDINEGMQPQTRESITFLKEFKTPFVVAATKTDMLPGWIPQEGACFSEALKAQPDRVRDALEDKLYKIVGQLGAEGFQAERYDRVKDFAKQISIVPVSGKTGMGVADLLVMLAGLAQRFLKGRLEVRPGEGKGTILEVKEFKGLGATIDVILYDGEIRKGDHLVIGGKEIVKTRVKALLKPEPLKELRVEKKFRQEDSVSAASGIKISAPGLEGVVAGSPVRAVRDEKELARAEEEVRKEIEEVEIETDKEGVLLKADTLGSLEALIKVLREKGIAIRKAQVGDLTKNDIMEIRSFKEPLIFAFNVRVPEGIKKLAKDNNIALFSSDIIYRLIEMHEEWVLDRKNREIEGMLRKAVHPGRVKILPGCVFRQCKPAVFGVEVLKGTIKPGYKLRKGKKVIGEIKELQSQGQNVDEAKSGDKVAISMEDVIVGKHIKEGDTLENLVGPKSLESLQRVRNKLREDEKELLDELLAG